MVIKDDHIEVEIRALGESALYRVENGSLSIPYGYDDAGFYRKCSDPIRHSIEARLEPGTDSFEMRSRHALHFDLVIAIARIHIIELLLTGRPHIGHGGAVQRLRNSNDRALLRNPEPQIVQASPFPRAFHAGLTRCMNGYSDNRPKVEIVTDTSGLIIDTRMADRIGINPPGTVTYDLSHTIEHADSGLDACTRVADKEDIGLRAIKQLLNTW